MDSVQSSVHLLTGKTPSTKVHCHRFVKTTGHIKEQLKNLASPTNEFLKKGGTLPSVLPSGSAISSEPPLKPQKHSYQDGDIYKAATICRSNKSTSLHKKMPMPVVKDPNASLRNGLDTHLLEKKMEDLSLKLSKVQDIILNQMTDALEHTHVVDDKTDSFSARDYALLVLEMNGNVPAQPYDPSEFSEDHLSLRKSNKFAEKLRKTQ